jgi:hypothetical protein
MNDEHEMTPQRYRDFLAEEGAYLDLCLSPLEPARFFAISPRSTREYRCYRDHIPAKMSREYLCRRPFHIGAKRTRDLRKELV